jgi:predicted nuclease of restriction endonuclease-like RecB superfamily
MWPERLLDVEIERGFVLPRYLTARDRLWVEVALDEVSACVGAPACEAFARLARPPGLGERPLAWRALCKLLLRLHPLETRACAPPPRLREVLFEEAERLREARPVADPDRAAPGAIGSRRAAAAARVAERLGVEPARVLRDLYADLPGERVLGPPREAVGAGELLERYNLALAQSLLLRCDSLQVRAAAELRGPIRFAHLSRLLCEVTRDPLGEGIVLSLSGPLALFHRTTKYGRAMAGWLPALAGVPGWELEAGVWLRGERWSFRASHRDGLAVRHAAPRRFDSVLEERFFRDLKRVAPRWRVLREADPVQVGRRILHPDFTLLDEQRGLRVPVELVGYWNPGYLAAKLEAVRGLPRGERWVLCLDQSLAAPGALDRLEDAGPVFRFRRRIEVDAFLAFLEDWLAASNPSSRSCPKSGPGGAHAAELY